MSMWKSEVKGYWDRARSEARCGWGMWRAVQTDDGWAVEDMNEQRIMETKHEHVAKLCGQLPELLERDLRPGEVLYVTTPSGATKPIPDVDGIGLMTEQECYDKGYGEGYDKGVSDQEAEQDRSEEKAVDDRSQETEATIDPSEIEGIDDLPADVRQALAEYEKLLSSICPD